MIKIKHIEKNKLSKKTLDRMYSILIDAYARTEIDVWGENYIRISKEEFIQLVLRGEIFGAFKKVRTHSETFRNKRLVCKRPQIH